MKSRFDYKSKIEKRESRSKSQEVGAGSYPYQQVEQGRVQAAEWEQGKILNFYGRFTPRLEKPARITQENYLGALVGTSLTFHEKKSREAYLNFLSGVVEDTVTQFELPKKISPEDAFRIESLAFSRALCVGVFEKRADDAIQELDIAKDFFLDQKKSSTDVRYENFLTMAIQKMEETQNNLRQKHDTYLDRDLPKSADSFYIFHSSLNRTRQIPSFETLLAEKFHWYIANDLTHNMPNVKFWRGKDELAMLGGPDLDRLQKLIANGYTNACYLYKEVENDDTPIYWEAEKKLEEIGEKRLAVFGRDGRYLFTALKAGDFGYGKKELAYVVVTDAMRTATVYDPSLTEGVVARYLKQNGITLDFAFLDTGFSGSIPEFAIECLSEDEKATLSKEEINERIKLLSSNKSFRQERKELSREMYAKKPSPRQKAAIDEIEGRPKTIESPHTLVMDKYGKMHPEMRPCSVMQQLRAWVTEQAVWRNFVPKLDANHLPLELKIDSPTQLRELEKIGITPEMLVKEEIVPFISTEKQNKKRRERFENFIKKQLADISPGKQKELLNDAMRLYEVSRDIVGPVIKDFASWCLQKTKSDQPLLFLARDAITPWIAARLLLKKGEFPALHEDQLHYAHLSHSIAHEENPEKLKKYLGQFGIHDDTKDLSMVDIGVYGAVHSRLKQLYPKKKIKSLFLISAARGPEFEGYLYDKQKQPKKELHPVWKKISGNFAVHFVEDTFSGFYGSVKKLTTRKDGSIRPDLTKPYSREIYLKRLAAMTGVIDRVMLDHDGKSEEEHKKALDKYLATEFEKEKEHLMVTHE